MYCTCTVDQYKISAQVLATVYTVLLTWETSSLLTCSQTPQYQTALPTCVHNNYTIIHVHT